MATNDSHPRHFGSNAQYNAFVRTTTRDHREEIKTRSPQDVASDHVTGVHPNVGSGTIDTVNPDLSEGVCPVSVINYSDADPDPERSANMNDLAVMKLADDLSDEVMIQEKIAYFFAEVGRELGDDWSAYDGLPEYVKEYAHADSDFVLSVKRDGANEMRITLHHPDGEDKGRKTDVVTSVTAPIEDMVSKTVRVADARELLRETQTS
jgi:hypothetical protein